MGWEWRVFFSVDATDVWSLLRPRDRPRQSPERRSDVYLKCFCGAGLKMRGGQILEVKLRSKRDDNGAELWYKVVSSHVKLDGKDLCTQFKKKLEKEKGSCKDMGVQLSLEEAMSSLSSPDQQLVELHKERRMKTIGAVSVEQTDITVSIEGRQPSKWRSVAVEGAQDKIIKFLEVPVCPPGVAGEIRLGDYLRTVAGEPRGYAQFVIDLLQP